jgi:periplasmic protein CpxP/Spy
MQPTRLTAFTLLGFALGVTVALSVPHVINPRFSVSAQSTVNANTSQTDQTDPTPSNAENQPRKLRPKRMGEIFQSLNLLPNQMQKLKSIRREYREQIRTQQMSVRETRQAMQQMIGGNTSSTAVLAKFEDLQQKQQSLNQLRFKSLLAMREILTLTQRQKLAEQMINRQTKLQRKNGQ